MPGDEYAGFHRSDVSRALAAGLRIRPIAQTVADTLRWTRECDSPRGDALTREREAELLAEWRSR
jgi:2'-hydroxyisoflavone reductase